MSRVQKRRQKGNGIGRCSLFSSPPPPRPPSSSNIISTYTRTYTRTSRLSLRCAPSELSGEREPPLPLRGASAGSRSTSSVASEWRWNYLFRPGQQMSDCLFVCPSLKHRHWKTRLQGSNIATHPANISVIWSLFHEPRRTHLTCKKTLDLYKKEIVHVKGFYKKSYFIGRVKSPEQRHYRGSRRWCVACCRTMYECIFK